MKYLILLSLAWAVTLHINEHASAEASRNEAVQKCYKQYYPKADKGNLLFSVNLDKTGKVLGIDFVKKSTLNNHEFWSCVTPGIEKMKFAAAAAGKAKIVDVEIKFPTAVK